MTDGGPSRRRNIAIVVAAAVVVVAGVVTAITLTVAGQGSDPVASPSASRTMSPSPLPLATGSPASSPAPTPATTPDPVYGAPVRQEVDKGQTASYGDGVTARITALASVSGSGSQVGDVAGPAVRVTVEVTNGSAAAIDGSLVELNVYLPDGSPASALSSSTATRLSGPIAAGASETGTWEFSVRASEQSDISVTLSRPGSADVLVFS